MVVDAVLPANSRSRFNGGKYKSPILLSRYLLLSSTASTIYNSVGTRVIILTHGWIKQLSRCAAIPPGLISKVNHVVADNEGDQEDSDEEYAVRQML